MVDCYPRSKKDSIKYFLLKARGAWFQKKIRDSRVNMKAINIYITESHKSMLHAIAKNSNCKMVDVISQLIEEKYFEINNK
ncbi:hypothetical protein AB182_04000 [Phytobacter ursingii]|uniref:Uncharacterized protein n=1 Tax=Phytobacter ursingii TaxID=1972431 RepID=A0AAC8QKM2_9ENTR|nr:hypothetical protein AB182_04000 [Phytobacter ursingii]